jgi:hypothetical protein
MHSLWQSLSTAAPFMAVLVLLHMWGNGTLYRMQRRLRAIERGCLRISPYEGSHQTRRAFVASIDQGWWWAVLPWPGKKKWRGEILTKVMLLGVEIEYVAVSELDWDEAYVITVDEQNKICSSSKVACAWAYLKHIGVEQ